MEVRFRRSYLERCADDVSQATRRWGTTVGYAYERRIELIRSARMFRDLFDFGTLDLHPLRGDRRGQYAMRLHGRWRLIVEPNENWDTAHIQEVTNHYDD